MRWRIIGFGLVFTSSCPLGAEPLSKPEDMELIRVLLRHSLSAHSKIKSLRLEQEWVTTSNQEAHPGLPIPAGRRIDRRRGIYLQRGDCYRCDYRCVTEVPGADFRKEERVQVILSDTFFAQVFDPPDAPVIRMCEFDSIRSMPETERELCRGSRPPHAGEYGYDVGEQTILAQLDLHPEVIKWTVVEESKSGSTLYKITRHNPYTGTTTYTIDAAKDYLITARKSLDLHGNLLVDIKVVPQRIGNVWLAQKVDELNPENNFDFHLNVLCAEVNIDIPRSNFDFDTLEFDRSKAVLHRYSRSAQPVAMIYFQGEWVPAQLVDRRR